MLPIQEPRIAVYDHACVFFWPRKPETARDKLLWRLNSTRECPFCRKPMALDAGLSGKAMPGDYVVICQLCGFWFGRGTKDYGDGLGAEAGRGVIGLIHNVPLDQLDVTLPEVVLALAADEKLLRRIDPFKAEELICHLLSTTYGWEVKHIGGRKDNGVDAFVIRGNNVRSIVQVKWRRAGGGAESVSLVREFAGTLLARGVPAGIIVTTSDRLSTAAIREIAAMKRHRIIGLGRIDIEYRTYVDVLAMLEFTSRRITDSPQVPVRPNSETYYIFDGNGIWNRSHHYMAGAKLVNNRPEWTDPLQLLSDFDRDEPSTA